LISLYSYLYFNSEGIISYSKSEECVKVLPGIIASGDLKALEDHFKKGARFHHMYNDKDFYLTAVVRCDNDAAALSGYLTVDEKSLLAKGEDGKHNAEIIFANVKILANLANIYKTTYGFCIKSDVLVKIFNDAEKNASDKTHFVFLRAAFDVKKEEEKKDEKKEETKKDEVKEVKADAPSDAKPEEVKADKQDDPKPEEKQDEAPKEGDQA
jgi:hypothetical protein